MISSAARVRATLIALALPCILSAQFPRVKDSAGVHIVENSARLKAPVVFRLSDKPTLDVGGLHDSKPAEELTWDGNNRGAVRLSDGTLVVGDPQQVKFFSRDGKLVKVVGRKGGGPQEFGGVYALCTTRGDTVVVTDQGNYRTAILSKSGEFVRTAPFLTERGFYPQYDGCLDDGTFVVMARDIAEQLSARTIKLLRLDLNGKQQTVIAGLPDAAFDIVSSRESQIVAHGSTIYFGNQLSHEIRLYSPAGKLVSMIRTSDPDVPIPAGAKSMMGGGSGSGAMSSSDMLKRRASQPHDTNWPAYARIKVDPQNRLWVQDFILDRPAPDAWTVFDASGHLIGRLIIPASADKRYPSYVMGFGKDDVLLRRFDDDGAMHYSVFSLIPVR